MRYKKYLNFHQKSYGAILITAIPSYSMNIQQYAAMQVTFIYLLCISSTDLDMPIGSHTHMHDILLSVTTNNIRDNCSNIPVIMQMRTLDDILKEFTLYYNLCV